MKQFTILIGFTFLFNLIFFCEISGQTNIQTYKHTAPIKDANYLKRTDVFLITQFDSIKQTLNIYVMNSTDSIVLLSTYSHGRGPFKTMIKDTREHWKDMSSYSPCYPRSNKKACPRNHEIRAVKIEVPPNSYIWKSYSFDKIVEAFRTKIQPSIKINDSIISVDPIEVVIDRSEALSEHEMILEKINMLLSEKEIKPEKKKELLLEKIRGLIVLKGRRKEAFALISEMSKKYPESDEVIYLKGQTIFHCQGVKGLSKANKFVLINATITEFERLKGNLDSYDFSKAKKNMKRYKKSLPTRTEWDSINDLECKEKDGRYYCFEKEILKDWVLIRFSGD